MSENLLPYLVVLGIFILWAIIRPAKKTPARASAPVKMKEPDEKRAHALAVYGAGKLAQKGLSDLMLSDYRFNTRIGSPSDTSLPVLERQLQSALMEMLTHLHQLPDIRLLVTSDPAKLSGPGRLGEYVHNIQAREIRILVQKNWNAEILLAGLCHECAHYFMYSLGINESNHNNDEGLTDAMTCLIGFSETVLLSKADRDFPYLNYRELEIVRKYLLEKRKELSTARDRAAELEAARTQLKKNLTGAREMCRQAESVVGVRKTPDTAKLTKAQLREISETLLDLETGSFEQTFLRAESALSGDLTQVKRADSEILTVCSRLYSLLLLYQQK